MSSVISNSEVQTFKRCKRKYMLTYYMQLGYPEDTFPPTGPMHIGIIVHDALEAKYGHGEDPLQVIRDIYAYHRSRWQGEENVHHLEAINKDEELALLMVEGYLQWLEDEGVDSQIEITGAESTVSAPLAHAGWTLLGKLDVRGVNKINGFKFFLDHKTVGDLVRPVENLEINEQFPTYGLLDRLTADENDHVDGGHINMLRRVKRTTRANPPFYKREPVQFNRHQLNSQWHRINAVVGEIIEMRKRLDAGEDHRTVAYPTPTGDCSWDCAFRKICPLMDDGSRWQDALNAEYVTIENPYARYTEKPLREVARARLLKAAASGTVHS